MSFYQTFYLLSDHIAHSLIPAKEVFLRSPLLKFSRPGDDILSWECHLRKAIDSGMNISELRLLLPPRCDQTLVLRVKTRLVQLPNQPERLIIDFWILKFEDISDFFSLLLDR